MPQIFSDIRLQDIAPRAGIKHLSDQLLGFMHGENQDLGLRLIMQD